MNVVVNKMEMEKCGQQIIYLSEEYNEKIKEMKNVADKIKNCWDGDDATTYYSMLTEKCIPTLEQLKEIIENYGIYLKKVAKTYYILDKNMTNKGKQGGYNAE